MTPLEKQLLVVRKLRQSLNESSAYFYLSPMLNSKEMIRKNDTCVLNPEKNSKKVNKSCKKVSNPL